MFTDRLRATLEFTTGGKTFPVLAGALKRFDLCLLPWGFSARAEIWAVSVGAQREDELFASFVKDDPIEVSMTLARAFDEVKTPAKPMALRGLVTGRRVVERAVAGVAGGPVLQRRYTVTFADRGAALWRQHRPTVLYVDKSYEDLIKDNTPEGVSVEHRWAAGPVKRPVLALGLGAAGGEGGASFHDFLFWLLCRENAGLYYDPAADQYAIFDEKPSRGEAELCREEVASLEATFPPVRRDTVCVLNASTEAPTNRKEIANKRATRGVRTDHLIRTPVAAQLDARVALETARAEPAEPEARAALRAFPATPLLPSMQVQLGGGWSTGVYQHGRTYRVLSARIRARAVSQEATEETGEESNSYRLEYRLRLELSSDRALRYPSFRRPTWPFHVEGRVVSEVGGEAEGTYQMYRDEATSLDRYHVAVPLWDDQKVVVPFEPGVMGGHFYFPASRGARVLLALDLNEARIAGFLEWRPGARLPLETQGNHILVGKGPESETSIRHVYEDGRPLLRIRRRSGEDVQVIEVEEGRIRLEAREAGR